MQTYIFIIGIVVCNLPGAYTDSSCKQTGACSCELSDGSVFDLSPVDTGADPIYTSTLEGSPGTVVTFNPCTEFSKGCQDARVCLSMDQSSYITIGKDIGFTYKKESNEAVFTYSASSSGATYKTIITLHCESGLEGPGTLNQLTVAPSGSTYYGNLDSQYGCVIKKKHSTSLSIGSILCILLLVFVVCYIAIGIVVNKYVRKLEGPELFPNLQFWKDLPSLIKDGCSFILSKISGGEKQQYEAIP